MGMSIRGVYALIVISSDSFCAFRFHATACFSGLWSVMFAIDEEKNYVDQQLARRANREKFSLIRYTHYDG